MIVIISLHVKGWYIDFFHILEHIDRQEIESHNNCDWEVDSEPENPPGRNSSDET